MIYNHNTLDNKILDSSIFKIKTIGESVKIPVGVYKLWGEDKQLSSKRTLPDVDAEILVSEINHKLGIYYSQQNTSDIEEFTNDMVESLHNLLIDVLKDNGFTEEEAQKHISITTGKKMFHKAVKNNIKKTKALRETSSQIKYYSLHRPLYNLLKSELNTNQNETHWYLAHFLVGMEIEAPPVKAAYERIRKSFRRIMKRSGQA